MRERGAGKIKTGRLPDGDFTLDQLLTFRTSSQWQYNKEQFREMVILLDESLPAMMHVEIETFEIFEPMNATCLAEFLKLPDDQYSVALRSRGELQGRPFQFDGETDSGGR